MRANQEQGGVPEYTIAHRLKMAREDYADITQDELAARTGISRRTISTYEDPKHQGRRSERNLRDLAQGCGVRLGWILTGNDSDPQGGGVIDLDSRRSTADQENTLSRCTERIAA